VGGKGAVPNPDSIRNKDHKPKIATKKLAAPVKMRGPELPDDVDWHSRTRAWWTTWRLSALTETFGATDWDYLLDTALLHTEFWNGNSKAAAEIRQRVGNFGATPNDRLRLYLDVTSPDSINEGAVTKTTVAKKTKAVDRKKRLLKVVPDIAS
jgi:hypothetical protein